MAIKRHKPEEIIIKLRQVEVLRGQGLSMADAIRQIGVTEVTFYRWRKDYGGMGTDQLKRLKALEKENDRLRKAVADLTLDKQILSEAARGRHLKPLSQKAVYRPGARQAWCLRTPGLSRPWSASLHTAPCAEGQGRRRTPCRRHDRTGQAVWPVRLSSYCRSPSRCWLAGQ